MAIVDSNGVPLEPGQLVAFNHSGVVRLGRIKDIGGSRKTKLKTPSFWYADTVIDPVLIERIIPHSIKTNGQNYLATDGISKVKNTDSIMVIDKDEILLHFI